jgi:hypothetical protein
VESGAHPYSSSAPSAILSMWMINEDQRQSTVHIMIFISFTDTIFSFVPVKFEKLNFEVRSGSVEKHWTILDHDWQIFIHAQYRSTICYFIQIASFSLYKIISLLPYIILISHYNCNSYKVSVELT